MSRVKISICDDPNDIAFRGTIGTVLSYGSDQENVLKEHITGPIRKFYFSLEFFISLDVELSGCYFGFE